MVTATDRFADLRATVLEQHAAIRERLHALDAGTALPESPLADVYLRLSLARLAAVFEAHLAFEELELAPRLRELDVWGPQREALMLAEHADRQQRLREMCAAVEATPSGAAALVAREASRLVAGLLECLDREERELDELHCAAQQPAVERE